MVHFNNRAQLRWGYGSHPFYVVVGDFNNDEKPDLAVANNDTDNLMILLQIC